MNFYIDKQSTNPEFKGLTLLVYAILGNHAEIAHFLIKEKKANPNAFITFSDRQLTPLMLFATNNSRNRMAF